MLRITVLDTAGTNMDYTRIGNNYTQATNKGEITMSGKNAIGMITEGGLLTMIQQVRLQ